MDAVVKQELARAAAGLAVMLSRLDLIRLQVASAMVGGADPAEAEVALATLDDIRQQMGAASKQVADLLGPEGQAEVVSAAIACELNFYAA